MPLLKNLDIILIDLTMCQNNTFKGNLQNKKRLFWTISCNIT